MLRGTPAGLGDVEMEVVLGTGRQTTVRLLGRSGRMGVGGRNLARCGRESRGSRGRTLLAGRRRRRRWRSPTLRRGPRQGGKSTGRQEDHFLHLSLQQQKNKLQMFPRMTSDLQARQAVRQERKVSQEVEDDSGAGRPLRFHIKININHIIFMFMTTIMIRSPDEKQASLHLSRERSLKSISNWWRSSLEGDHCFQHHLHFEIIKASSSSSSPSGGPIQPSSPTDCWTEPESTTSPRHNHSHSDSGISSMSGQFELSFKFKFWSFFCSPGRSSCISPMSELSSSSGSSRTSLRSSSIVSASNILLEEEGEEEVEYKDLCKELLLFAPPDSRISGIISKIWTTSQSHRSSLSFQGQI